jgi:prephenate dehydrogenase
MLDAIQPVLRPDAVVTDVASTKGRICTHARNAFPAPCRFIGSHPMAGSEKSGPEHSIAALYEGCYTFVEAQTDHHAPDAHAAVVELWRALGAEVRQIAPELHDATLARTSHVPHVAATCLARLTEQCPDPRPFVAGGFRDTTRVAAGPAEVWRDICLTNRDAVLDALDSLQTEIGIIRAAVADNNGVALEDFFRKGAEARARALEGLS